VFEAKVHYKHKHGKLVQPKTGTEQSMAIRWAAKIPEGGQHNGRESHGTRRRGRGEGVGGGKGSETTSWLTSNAGKGEIERRGGGEPAGGPT